MDQLQKLLHLLTLLAMKFLEKDVIEDICNSCTTKSNITAMHEVIAVSPMRNTFDGLSPMRCQRGSSQLFFGVQGLFPSCIVAEIIPGLVSPVAPASHTWRIGIVIWQSILYAVVFTICRCTPNDASKIIATNALAS